jgi:glycosyltransferase involved in cell wall biosynthesis
MRVLILVDCYVPSPKSGAKLIHDLAKEFVRQGHETIVVTPDETLQARRRTTSEDGITAVRVGSGRIKGAGKVIRAINEIRLSSIVWRACRDFFRETPCDLVVYYSPTIFFGKLVARLKRLWNCRTYLILRDIFPQWAVDAGVLRKGSLPHRYFRRKEAQQYAVADVIGVQTSGSLEYFRQGGLSGGTRLEVLWHWSAVQEGGVPPTDFRRRLGLKEKVVFFFGGNIGVAQDMDNLVRLAEGLQTENDIHFVLMGSGSEVPRLSRVVKERGLGNISMLPPVGQGEYLGVLSEFDVGLVSLGRGLKTQNFPGKMLGYLEGSLPVLASINPGNDLKVLIEENDIGLVSFNGEPELFREHALKLARDPELRRRLGQNGRRLLEESFSTRRAAEQILGHLSVAKAGGHRAESQTGM